MPFLTGVCVITAPRDEHHIQQSKTRLTPPFDDSAIRESSITARLENGGIPTSPRTRLYYRQVMGLILSPKGQSLFIYFIRPEFLL